MNNNNSNSIFKHSDSPYAEEELKLLWIRNKRPAVYESGVLHGENCLCCERIPKDTIIRNKAKLGRKAGGQNKK
jgi:hypothetical protein